jgi:hypothetical protein
MRIKCNYCDIKYAAYLKIAHSYMTSFIGYIRIYNAVIKLQIYFTLHMFIDRNIAAFITGSLCDKVYQWLVAGRWFSPGTPVSSTNKTDRRDITEILLKVVLNNIALTKVRVISFLLIKVKINCILAKHLWLRAHFVMSMILAHNFIGDMQWLHR